MKNTTLIIVLFLLSNIALAQPPAPPATPIDGGLGLLLAAGVAFGIKKLKSKNN
ncbi:MAG: hypothetical protein ABJN36_06825 [Cyclobacteriaceae bacterium]